MATGRIAVILLSALVCGVFGKDHVPVLVWNTNQAQGGLPAVSALQYITYGTFQAKYLQAFKPKNILLFLQDALSVEDLSSHATEFHHINQWMEKSHSLYLPNVENAGHLAHDLPTHGYSVVVLEPGVPVAGLNLKQQDNNLIVVKLPSTLTNPSRSRALQKADEVMQNVISKIGQQREFTVIFTGLKPSVEDNSEQYEERIRVARSLKAADPIYPFGFHTSTCVLILLHNNMTINYYKSNSTSSPPDKIAVIDEGKSEMNGTGDCSAKGASNHIKYKDLEINGEIIPKAYFQFHFTKNYDEWTFTGVQTNVEESTTILSFVPVKNDVAGIPIGMSFSCSQKIVLRGNGTNVNGYTVELVLNGAQLQPYTKSPSVVKFGDAWDCVGFFTVSIWAGLLATLLLVIILSSGMYMLSDIKTMDRFDDPKGQPIMVPAAE